MIISEYNYVLKKVIERDVKNHFELKRNIVNIWKNRTWKGVFLSVES